MKQHPESHPAPEARELAQRIRQFTAECNSPAEFGGAFIRNALTDAAAIIQARDGTAVSADLSVKVNVRFSFPEKRNMSDVPKPSPDDPRSIDVCYEICAVGEHTGNFWACYGACAEPPDVEVPQLPSPVCSRLWGELRRGDATALLRLINNGCLELTTVQAALEPLMYRAARPKA